MSENNIEEQDHEDDSPRDQPEPEAEDGEQNTGYPNGDDVTAEDDHGSADG